MTIKPPTDHFRLNCSDNNVSNNKAHHHVSPKTTINNKGYIIYKSSLKNNANYFILIKRKTLRKPQDVGADVT